MGQEIVDLYMTLRLIAAPFVAGAAEVTAAAERMALAVTAATKDATIGNDRMAKASTVAAEAISIDTSKMVSSNARLAASIGSASKEWQHGFQAMAATTTELTLQMEMAEAKAGAAAEAMGAKIDAAARSTTATTLGQGEKLKQIAMGAALTAGIAAVASLKMAGDFESSTNRLETSAGETHQGLEVVRKGILNLAGEVGVSADHMVKAMYMIESASYHGEAGLGVLKAAMQGAKAEGAEEAKVANALTSALRDYYPHASSAADVTAAAATTMSKFIGATSAGKMTFDDLAGALHTLLPAAMAAGVGMDDALAALASMTVHGMSAEQATQNLAHALGHLQTLTAPQAKEFAMLGISANDLKEHLSERGLTGTVELIGNAIKEHMGADSKRVVIDLNDALKKLPPEVRTLGKEVLDGSISMGAFSKETKKLDVESAGLAGSFATMVKTTHGLGKEQKDGAVIWQTYSEALKAAMGDQTGLNVALMVGGENMDYTKSALDQINKAMPDAEGNVKGWAEVQGTFNQKLAEAKDALGAMAIKIGNVLLPAASAIAGVFADAAKWISRNEDAAKALAIVIGTVVVASLAAGTVGLIKWIANLGPMVTAVGGATLKLGLLATGFEIGLTHMDSFAGIATLVVTGISAVGTAVSLLNGPLSSVGGMVGGVKGALSEFGGAFGAAEGVVGKFKVAAGGAMSFLTGPWGIALGLAVGAIALFAGGSKDASKAVDDLTKAIEQDSGQLGTNTRAWLANKLEKDGALASAKKLGFDEHELTSALMEQGPALDGVKRKLEDLVKAHTHQELATAGGKGGSLQYANVLDDTAKSAKGLIGELDGVAGSITASKDAATRQAAAMHESAGALHDHAVAAVGAVDGGKDLAATSKTVTDAMASEKNEAKLLTDQLDFLNGGEISATKGAIKFKDSIDATVNTLKDNGKTLDMNSDKGRKNLSTILDAVGAATDHAKAVATQTHSVEEGNKVFADDIRALQGVMAASGIAGDTIKELTDKYMKVPPAINTTVNVDTSAAQRQLSNLNLAVDRTYQNALKRGAATGGHMSKHFAGGGVAHFDWGGAVSGMGTESSDSIPAMLSDDEYVTRARSTRKVGVPVMDAINQGDVNAAYRMLGARPDVNRGAPAAMAVRGGGSNVTVINKYETHAGAIVTERELSDIVQRVVLRYGQRNNGSGLVAGWNT